MNHKWNNRTVASPDHAKELEAAAAEHEFGPLKLPRDQAEEHAYADYKSKNHREGAAHHLRNLRVAVANGDRKEAERHSSMYKLHIQGLGLNASHPAPTDVEELARKPMTEKMHRSSHHKSDALLMSGPMSKTDREHVGYMPLEKAAGQGFEAPKGPQQQQMKSAGPAAAPAPSASGAHLKVGQRPTMSGNKNTISGKEAEAGKQHFDEGSTVKYHDIYGDHYIPPDYIGTVVRHHLVTLHSQSHQGPTHMYELRWVSPDGKMIDDFVEQDRLQPFKGAK